MHYGLVLAELGAALLGPILRLLAHQWAMQDSQSELLMMAKFCGARPSKNPCRLMTSSL
jgi:FHS family glucose/mannose:H+ symporter-like MFS transporter